MNTVLLGWIAGLPLMGFCVMGALSFLRLSELHRKIVVLPFALGIPLVSALLTMMLFWTMPNDPAQFYLQRVFTWISLDSFHIDLALRGDRLSVYMSLFITGVGALIHLYAVGYMWKDRAFTKFFAYFHLFMASMLLLVLADNPFVMFVGWEGVGLCSYFLISYFHTDSRNVLAGNKAFIVNRVGDLGFLIGLMLLFYAVGSYGMDFSTLSKHVSEIDLKSLSVIGFMLFIGAMGKSAQIPLYVWLPDAMAGPTPVSALIHAATMVTAGVYMVARFGFLYDLIPHVGVFIAYIGVLSALLAAVIATKQSDIKKILAYSTMSQLGYMFIAVGLGYYDAGLFHVLTHAFFKALLFLGAGSVLFALHHEQNIFKMGGLKNTMVLTYVTMGIGVLALAGLPPFSGFFSKDLIMVATFSKGHYLLWGGALITVGLTAYYMTRLMTLVFLAPAYKHYSLEKPHVSMQGVLVVLALGALVSGLIGVPEVLGGEYALHMWLMGEKAQPFPLSHTIEYCLMVLNIGVAIGAMTYAYRRFRHGAKEPTHGFVVNKFFIDELYMLCVVMPLKQLSRFFDSVVDQKGIDRAIVMVSVAYYKLGFRFDALQNANLRSYARYMLIGMAVIFMYLFWMI
jgi:NADH-quinone oxidoreductase subunit L